MMWKANMMIYIKLSGYFRQIVDCSKIQLEHHRWEGDLLCALGLKLFSFAVILLRC